MRSVLYGIIMISFIFYLYGMDEKPPSMIADFYEQKDAQLFKTKFKSPEKAFTYFEKLLPSESVQNVIACTRNYYNIDLNTQSKTGIYKKLPLVLQDTRLVSFQVGDAKKYGIYRNKNVFFDLGLNLSYDASKARIINYFSDKTHKDNPKLVESEDNCDKIQLPSLDTIAQAYHVYCVSNYIDKFLLNCMQEIVFISPRSAQSRRIDYTAGADQGSINIASYDDLDSLGKDDTKLLNYIKNNGLSYFHEDVLQRPIACFLKDWNNPILNGNQDCIFTNDDLQLAYKLSEKGEPYNNHIKNLADKICQGSTKCYPKDFTQSILHYFYKSYFPLFCKNKIDMLQRQKKYQKKLMVANTAGIGLGLFSLGFAGNFQSERFSQMTLCAGLGTSMVMYNMYKLLPRIVSYNNLSAQIPVWTQREQMWREAKEAD